VRVFAAILIGLAIVVALTWLFRALARTRSPEEEQAPEDVSELDVYFVCGECGTEFRVEKLGELQVPRHCGERMRVERRPFGLPSGTG
jgi:hypothetical protein